MSGESVSVPIYAFELGKSALPDKVLLFMNHPGGRAQVNASPVEVGLVGVLLASFNRLFFTSHPSPMLSTDRWFGANAEDSPTTGHEVVVSIDVTWDFQKSSGNVSVLTVSGKGVQIPADDPLKILTWVVGAAAGRLKLADRSLSLPG